MMPFSALPYFTASTSAFCRAAHSLYSWAQCVIVTNKSAPVLPVTSLRFCGHFVSRLACSGFTSPGFFQQAHPVIVNANIAVHRAVNNLWHFTFDHPFICLQAPELLVQRRGNLLLMRVKRIYCALHGLGLLCILDILYDTSGVPPAAEGSKQQR
jgi:hypothetical protein